MKKGEPIKTYGGMVWYGMKKQVRKPNNAAGVESEMVMELKEAERNKCSNIDGSLVRNKKAREEKMKKPMTPRPQFCEEIITIRKSHNANRTDTVE